MDLHTSWSCEKAGTRLTLVSILANNIKIAYVESYFGSNLNLCEILNSNPLSLVAEHIPLCLWASNQTTHISHKLRIKNDVRDE